MFLRTATLSWPEFWQIATDPRTLAALRLSFGAACVAAVLNLVMGTLVAWVLVRYDFPLKRLLDAIVDLPFALPTAVAGIALAAIYAPNGWIGQFLDPLGHQGRLLALGRGRGADLHRPAVRRPHRAAGDPGPAASTSRRRRRRWAPRGCRRWPAWCCRPWRRPC